jgi:hypothetical protein
VSQDLLAQAKRRLPMSALMAQLGFGDRAKKSARCPFHEDSSAMTKDEANNHQKVAADFIKELFSNHASNFTTAA